MDNRQEHLDNLSEIRQLMERSSSFISLSGLSGISAVFLLTSFFTARKAKKKGLSVWDGSAKRMLISLFIPLTCGGIFCIILLYHHFDFIILPSMLIFYGLALINAGTYTLNEIKWLGISQIILGFAALLFLGYV